MTRREKAKLWKCQKCGLTFLRRSPGEPRRCPQCLDRGCKTHIGKEARS